MSEPLQKIAFTEELLGNRQLLAFDCGSEVWEAEVAEWLKLPKGRGGAVDASLQEGTSVWLYVTADGLLVGYGCVGHGHLKWPNPNKSPQILSTTIPMLGVATAHRGRGYGKAILSDLLDVARTRAAQRRIVVLSVHEKNPAIRLYSRCNFKPSGKPRLQPPGNDLYQRFVLDLLDAPAGTPAAP